MRVKCINESQQITDERIYHLMKEDEGHYYIVDDYGRLTQYPKTDFVIVDTCVQIVSDIGNFSKGEIFKLDGIYVSDDTKSKNYVVKTDIGKIVIPSSYARIIES